MDFMFTAFLWLTSTVTFTYTCMYNYYLCNHLQAQLAEIELQEEDAKKQLESMKESSRKSLKRHQLERENRQLSEKIKKLSSFEADATTLINNLKAEIRELGKEKETLQNKVQVVKIEVCLCYCVTLCFLFHVQLDIGSSRAARLPGQATRVAEPRYVTAEFP